MPEDILRPPVECVCGGDIECDEGTWYHTRIEDFSHEAKPKTEAGA